MLIIFVDQITLRIEYTLDFIFAQRGLEYRVTNDDKELNIGLFYSKKKVDGRWIQQASLMNESNVSAQTVSLESFQNQLESRAFWLLPMARRGSPSRA